MARVVKNFTVPEDPRYPRGAVRRALWRTMKGSLSAPGANMKPLVLIGIGWLLYEWGNPHVLYSYSYYGYSGARVYTRCEYLGLTPFTTRGGYCPLIVWTEWPRN